MMRKGEELRGIMGEGEQTVGGKTGEMVQW